MDAFLTFPEARVFGCLLEKEMATPDYYPMTANSLAAACNQSSNRDPVMAYDDATVDEALAGLRHKKLAAMMHLAGSRAPKYKHLAEEFFPGLDRPERALLAVLVLRGAQSVAELRTRTERLHAFADAGAVETSLAKLTGYQTGPLAIFQPPGQGRRAATYAPLLCGSPMPLPETSAAAPAPVLVADWRTAMENQLASLATRVKALEEALGGPPVG